MKNIFHGNLFFFPFFVNIFNIIFLFLLTFLFVRDFMLLASIFFLLGIFCALLQRLYHSQTYRYWYLFYKTLIIICVLLLIPRYLHPFLACVFIFLELFTFGSMLYRTRHGGKIVPVKVISRIKMICESVGIGFVFLFVLTSSAFVLITGWVLLCMALFFAFLSLFVYKSI